MVYARILKYQHTIYFSYPLDCICILLIQQRAIFPLQKKMHQNVKNTYQFCINPYLHYIFFRKLPFKVLFPITIYLLIANSEFFSFFFFFFFFETCINLKPIFCSSHNPNVRFRICYVGCHDKNHRSYASSWRCHWRIIAWHHGFYHQHYSIHAFVQDQKRS